MYIYVDIGVHDQIFNSLSAVFTEKRDIDFMERNQSEVGFKKLTNFWAKFSVWSNQVVFDINVRHTSWSDMRGVHIFFYKQPNFRVEPRVAIKIPKMRLKVAKNLLRFEARQLLAKLLRFS